jgi:hypothetical protein
MARAGLSFATRDRAGWASPIANVSFVGAETLLDKLREASGKTGKLGCALLVVVVLYTLMDRQLSQRLTDNFMTHGTIQKVLNL